MTPFIRHFAAMFTVIALSSTLGGCITTGNVPFNGPDRKFTVEQQPVFYAVHFDALKAELSREEKSAIESFLSGFSPAKGERISVSFDTQQINPATTLAADRSQAVLKYLRELGFKPGVSGVPPYVASDEVAIIRLTPKLVAPNCPDWSKTPNSNFDNTTNSNFNCSNLSNLGMMVVNPMDLVDPAEISPADANNGVMSIQRYRADQVKELPKDTPTKKN
jgi:pilus assembly protein CpaD